MFIVISVVAIIIIVMISASNSQKKIAALKLRYEESLKGNDKKSALNAGRAYYSALRKDKNLTIYDEQAITNDLSTMS
jgi:hypothetical protein